MAYFLVPIISTLALFFIMAVDMADSHSHYCAGVPPIEDFFYDFVDTCYIQGMLDTNGDILTSCANITIREHHDEVSGSTTIEGIDASGNFQQKKFTWQEVDDDFQLITDSEKNPVAQVKAIAHSDASATVQSVIYENDDGYVMATCPFSEETQKPGELQNVIICTWARYMTPANINILFTEAKRRGINVNHVTRVDRNGC